MSDIVLLHAAGARLGVGHGREGERRAAFERLVKTAVTEPPKALLVAGGLLGTATAPSSLLEPLERGLERLAEAGVPVVVAASRQERSGESPRLLEWLASRGRIRLLDTHRGADEVELEPRLSVVGTRALPSRKRERDSRKRKVLLMAEPVGLSRRELDRFAYVAAGGRPAREECAPGMHDPGPLAESSPGSKPVFLRVHLGSGPPRVEEVASGAPHCQLLELDVTHLADADQLVDRAVAAAGELAGRLRRLRLRLVGKPVWPEESLDRRALADRIAAALGSVEVEAVVATDLRLSSGRGLPSDASLEAIEEAVLADLLTGSAEAATAAEPFATLAAGALKGLAGSDPEVRHVMAERLDAFRRAEVDGAR